MNNYKEKIAEFLKAQGYDDRIGCHADSIINYGLIRNKETHLTLFYKKEYDRFDFCEIDISFIERAYKSMSEEDRDRILGELKEIKNDNLSIHIYSIDEITEYWTGELTFPYRDEDIYNLLKQVNRINL